jgi:hypothetical protein
MVVQKTNVDVSPHVKSEYSFPYWSLARPSTTKGAQALFKAAIPHWYTELFNGPSFIEREGLAGICWLRYPGHVIYNAPTGVNIVDHINARPGPLVPSQAGIRWMLAILPLRAKTGQNTESKNWNVPPNDIPEP